MKILIKDAVYLSPEKKSGNIAIADGKIYALDNPVDFTADKIINGNGLLVIPGLVDLGMKLHKSGQINSILSESKAAVAAGVTTICLSPDTNPLIDNPAVVELIKQRRSQVAKARVLPVGMMADANNMLTNMGALINEGCIGVGNTNLGNDSLNLLHKSMSYATTLGITLHLQAHNQELAQKGSAHAGAPSTILGLAGISHVAETIALSQIIFLAEETGAKVHISRLSSAQSVQMIRQAKNQNLSISADVGIHHLFFCDEYLLGAKDNIYQRQYDTNLRALPPYRSPSDRSALRAGVLDGTIDVITSDHQPQDADSKLKPFSEASLGMSSLDTYLPQLLQFCAEESISLEQILPAITSNPARIIDKPLGKITEGGLADLALIDCERSWILNTDNFVSAGQNTPFFGQSLKGQNQISLVNGEVVFDRSHT